MDTLPLVFAIGHPVQKSVTPAIYLSGKDQLQQFRDGGLYKAYKKDHLMVK
jgi:hypothetical protein